MKSCQVMSHGHENASRDSTKTLFFGQKIELPSEDSWGSSAPDLTKTSKKIHKSQALWLPSHWVAIGPSQILRPLAYWLLIWFRNPKANHLRCVNPSKKMVDSPYQLVIAGFPPWLVVLNYYTSTSLSLQSLTTYTQVQGLQHDLSVDGGPYGTTPIYINTAVFLVVTSNYILSCMKFCVIWIYHVSNLTRFGNPNSLLNGFQNAHLLVRSWKKKSGFL